MIDVTLMRCRICGLDSFQCHDKGDVLVKVNEGEFPSIYECASHATEKPN